LPTPSLLASAARIFRAGNWVAAGYGGETLGCSENAFCGWWEQQEGRRAAQGGFAERAWVRHPPWGVRTGICFSFASLDRQEERPGPSKPQRLSAEP